MAPLEMTDTSQRFIVADSRYHEDPGTAEYYFATNDLNEAKLVANEVCFNAVILKNGPLGEIELVYDAAFNTELALEP